MKLKESRSYLKQTNKQSLLFRSLSRPNTFAGAPSLMLAQCGDKCPAVEKAVTLIFAQLRPSSEVPE